MDALTERLICDVKRLTGQDLRKDVLELGLQ